jgi:hypothetical protein
MRAHAGKSRKVISSNKIHKTHEGVAFPFRRHSRNLQQSNPIWLGYRLLSRGMRVLPLRGANPSAGTSVFQNAVRGGWAEWVTRTTNRLRVGNAKIAGAQADSQMSSMA